MNYQKKKEVEYMFKPQKNITNAGYGFQNLDLNMKDRYIVGNIMNNKHHSKVFMLDLVLIKVIHHNHLVVSNKQIQENICLKQQIN